MKYVGYFCPILTTIGMCRKMFEKFPNMEPHANSFSAPVLSCAPKDERTDFNSNSTRMRTRLKQCGHQVSHRFLNEASRMIGMNCDEPPKALKATRFIVQTSKLLYNKNYGEYNGQEILTRQIVGLWFCLATSLTLLA